MHVEIGFLPLLLLLVLLSKYWTVAKHWQGRLYLPTKVTPTYRETTNCPLQLESFSSTNFYSQSFAMKPRSQQHAKAEVKHMRCTASKAAGFGDLAEVKFATSAWLRKSEFFCFVPGQMKMYSGVSSAMCVRWKSQKAEQFRTLESSPTRISSLLSPIT